MTGNEKGASKDVKERGEREKGGKDKVMGGINSYATQNKEMGTEMIRERTTPKERAKQVARTFLNTSI
jgi:hypothetical protein